MAKRKPKAEKSEYGEAPPPHGGEVAAWNYQKLCEQFTAKLRPSDRAALMIRNWRGARASGNPETPERWAAWMAFFRGVVVADRIIALAEHLGELAVPARWPWDFAESGRLIEGRLDGLIRAYAAQREEAKGPRPLLADADRQLSEGERERIKESRAEADKTARAEQEARSAALGADRLAFDQECRRRSFEDRGVEPPPLKEGELIGMSFELMTQLGWTIGPGPGGTSVMVPPAGKQQS